MKFSKSRFNLSWCGLLLCCWATLVISTLYTVQADTLPSASGSYADLGGGVIKDNATGLVWQQDTAPGTYTWQQAIEYCENLILGGYDDWRLPTIKELSTLVDSGVSLSSQNYNPTIDATFFPDTRPDFYWSLTAFAGNLVKAWTVDFFSGSDANPAALNCGD